MQKTLDLLLGLTDKQIDQMKKGDDTWKQFEETLTTDSSQFTNIGFDPEKIHEALLDSLKKSILHAGISEHSVKKLGSVDISPAAYVPRLVRGIQ
jgi:uncharacterized protein with von Willebrand factor type A (vWA) domain